MNRWARTLTSVLFLALASSACQVEAPSVEAPGPGGAMTQGEASVMGAGGGTAVEPSSDTPDMMESLGGQPTSGIGPNMGIAPVGGGDSPETRAGMEADETVGAGAQGEQTPSALGGATEMSQGEAGEQTGTEENTAGRDAGDGVHGGAGGTQEERPPTAGRDQGQVPMGGGEAGGDGDDADPVGGDEEADPPQGGASQQDTEHGEGGSYTPLGGAQDLGGHHSDLPQTPEGQGGHGDEEEAFGGSQPSGGSDHGGEGAGQGIAGEDHDSQWGGTPDQGGQDDHEPPPCALNYEVGTRHLDVAYASNHERQRLDIIETTAPGPNPVVVWIHGGGWHMGAKSPPVFGDLPARGYVVVPIEYRLSDQGWPSTLLDVKAAIRWIRANASTYGMDPDRIAVMGSSAGGHLSAFLGTSQGIALFEDESLGDVDVSSDVQLVVNFYGPSSFVHLDDDAAANGCPPSGNPPSGTCHLCDDSPESALLGCSPTACPDRAAQASPITHVDGHEPPFLTVHGDGDCSVPTPQSQRLHDALLAAGSDSTLIIAEGAGHNVRECLRFGVEDQVIAFVESHMRGCAHVVEVQEVPEDAQVGACLYENCFDLALQCESSDVCLPLEACFQQCFAETPDGDCINVCVESLRCGDDTEAPCLSPDNYGEVVNRVHRPLFECGRPAGCYPMEEEPQGDQLNACLHQNCSELAAQCEALDACVPLEACFQRCFAERPEADCIEICIASLRCDEGTAPPCLSMDNYREVVHEVHRPLFECGGPLGCYPRDPPL